MSAQLPNLADYQTGADRYVRFAENELGVALTREQKQLLRSLAEHKRTIIMSGNGPGKSYGVAIAKVAYLWVNHGSKVLGTSGSYSQYTDAVWRSMKTLHGAFADRLPIDVPEPNDSGQPSLNLADDWFAKVISPRDPGDLEGRHGEHVFVVIEEADKKYITDEHFDSVRSSVTDGNDRMLAICNPPKDEANPVYERLTSDEWNTIQFSTLHSHNVRVDAGEIPGPKIPGITDLETIIDDWQAYNDREWPGLDAARRYSDPSSDEFREDLDSRWYRRRAGVIPPAGSSAHRPIEPDDVKAAWERQHPSVVSTDMGTGVDAARSGADSTVAASAIRATNGSGGRIDVRYQNGGADYTVQRDELSDLVEPDPDHPIAVDAIGEGSGLADMLAERFPGVIRFGAGKEPQTDEAYVTYKSCWGEGLDLLGDALAEGASIDDRKLFEELMAAAREVEFEERHYSKRGTEVFKTTASKDDVKERVGRSPDRLDAAYMAVWARDSGASSQGGFSHVGSMSDLF